MGWVKFVSGYAKDQIFEKVFHPLEQMLLQSNGGFCRAKVLWIRLSNEGKAFLLQLFRTNDLLFEQVFHLIEQMLIQSNGGFCRAKVLYGRLANEGQVFRLSFEQSGLLLIPTGGVYGRWHIYNNSWPSLRRVEKTHTERNCVCTVVSLQISCSRRNNKHFVISDNEVLLVVPVVKQTLH